MSAGCGMANERVFAAVDRADGYHAAFCLVGHVDEPKFRQQWPNHALREMSTGEMLEVLKEQDHMRPAQ